MSSIQSYVGSLVFGLLLCGCGSSGGKVQNDVCSSDSSDFELPPQVVVTEMLPDTAYASVSDVNYKVTVADESADGRLSDLTDMYAGSPSVLTFRGGEFRQGLYGRIDTMPTRLRTEWRIDTDYETQDTIYGPWGGGSGWTGQPLYVEWPDSVAQMMKRSGVVTADFSGREVIVGSLCGKLYFLNPHSGKHTRTPIDAGNPIKGTPSVDPTFNGNLYVGQGVPASRPFGALVIDLKSNRRIDFFVEDPNSWRGWGAYDSSPIRVGRFLFRPAENGAIYKYIILEKGIRLQSVLRYRIGGMAPGIESSMAVYSNYGYVADNHGNVLAVNLNTMHPVWHYSLGDDTDATPMIAVEGGTPYIYVGCEVDRNQSSRTKFAKLEALTGTPVWERGFTAVRVERGKKHFDGGFYASPLLGKGDCDGLIFTNIVENTNGYDGAFLAINRKDGTIAYRVKLNCYSWSSPVGFLTPEGRMVVVTGDAAGYLYLLEGASGKEICKEKVGYNFESSPLVIGNSVVIGSRSNGIFKVTLE